MKEVGEPHSQLAAETLDLLQDRAERLAKSEEKAASLSVSLEAGQNIYVCFRLFDVRYGLPLGAVCEAIPLRNMIHIPGAPAHVTGLIRLRGKVLSVVDLRRFLHRDVTGHADSDLVVIIEEGGVELGILCTEMLDLLGFAPDEIKATPQNLPARLSACLRGLARRDIMLIDPKRLLAQPGFLVDMGQEEG